MPERALKYRLAEPNPEDFIYIPRLNFDIAKKKARTPDGKVLTKISWCDVKSLIQSLGSDYSLPTSSQWSKAREYLQRKDPELEEDFITFEAELVNSLVAFPNKKGEYSPRLQVSGIKKGKVPLLIEQSKVERSGGSYVVTEGNVTEVPELPSTSGYIREWSKELGLPTKVGEYPSERFGEAYFWVNTDYIYDEGLRVLIRGPSFWPRRMMRFSVIAVWGPSFSSSDVSFRLCRVTSTDQGFVRVPRTKYEEMIELTEMLNKLLLRTRV